MTRGLPSIEWIPSRAGAEALGVAGALYPHLSRPALIEKLLITGLWALKQPPWRPPQLWGNNRKAWTFPSELREVVGGDASELKR